MNEFLMIVAAVWAFSALAVIVLFIVDERAHRRRIAGEPAAPQPIRLPDRLAGVRVARAPARHLASSGAR